ncbi:hypothetical protein [Candidatus Harpocratesius sp.]
MLIEISEDKLDKNLSKIVNKINQFYEKGKITKISNQIDKIFSILDNRPSSAYIYLYILSILVEELPDLISLDFIDRIKQSYIIEGTIDERANAIIIYGWTLLHSFESERSVDNAFIQSFIELLGDSSLEVRSNTVFFLNQFPEEYNAVFLLNLSILTNCLKNESNSEILEFLENILLRIQPLMSIKILKSYLNDIVQMYEESNIPKRSDVLLNLLQIEIFGLKEAIQKHRTKRDLLRIIHNRPPLVRYMDLNEIAEKQQLDVDKVENYLQAETDENLYYSLVFTEKHHKKMLIFDKQELFQFLSGAKLELNLIIKTFTHVGITNHAIGAILLRDLIDKGEIEGHLTKQFFYSKDFIKQEIEKELTKMGLINIETLKKRYNSKLIEEILEEITNNPRFSGIYSKDRTQYYTFARLKQDIENKMTRNNVIDLRTYQDQFGYENFLRLEQFCREQLFNEFHKDHLWLTNLGMTRIQQSIRTSEQIGEANLEKISKQLGIPVEIYRKVVKPIFTKKNGFWNRNNTVFYFSKYVKKRIAEIQSEPNVDIRKSKIHALAEELQIGEEEISQKVDEKLDKIAKELMNVDEVEIKPLMRDLQMDYSELLQFIDSLGHPDGYLILDNKIIFSAKRIQEEKSKISSMILKQAARNNILDVARLSSRNKVAPQLLIEAIQQNKSSGKIQGLWLQENERFLTIKGIYNRMKNAEGYIDLNSFLEERTADEEEIEFLEGILKQLMDDHILSGVYDSSTKVYQNDDIASKASLITERERFTKEVLPLIEDLERAYTYLSEIFLKKDIHPGDIEEYDELLENTIRKIFNAEATIKRMINNANRRLNRDLLSSTHKKERSLKKQRSRNSRKKSTKKLFNFKDDEDVSILLNDFANWKDLILAIEQKKGEIVFLKKKIKANPKDIESKNKLEKLLKYLGFTE